MLNYLHKLVMYVKMNMLYLIKNKTKRGNRLQAIILIKSNKLELSNNQINSLKVNHLK